MSSTRITVNGVTENVNGAHPDAVLRHLFTATQGRLKDKRKELERYENAAIAAKIEVETLQETVDRYLAALTAIPITEPAGALVDTGAAL